MMRNKLHAQSKLKSSNVVHEFKCPNEDCALHPRSYWKANRFPNRLVSQVSLLVLVICELL